MATDFTLDIKQITSGEWITYLHSLLYKCGVEGIADPPTDTVDDNTWNFMFFQSDHSIEERVPYPAEEAATSMFEDYPVVGPLTWAALEDEANWVDRGQESTVVMELVQLDVSGTGVAITAKNTSGATAKAHQHTDYLGHDIEEHDREHRGWLHEELEADVSPGGQYTAHFEMSLDQQYWKDEGGGQHVLWVKLNGGYDGDEGRGNGGEARYMLTVDESGARVEAM